jgi:hypothetical protein
MIVTGTALNALCVEQQTNNTIMATHSFSNLLQICSLMTQNQI